MGITVTLDPRGIGIGIGQRVFVPDGIWPAQLIKWANEQNKEKTGQNHKFDVAILDGPAKGAIIHITTGTDMSKEGNKRVILQAVVSAGYPKDLLLQAELRVNEEDLVNKQCYIQAVNPPAGEKDDKGREKFCEYRFAPVESYQEFLQAQRTKAALTGGVSTPGQASAPSQAPAAVAPSPSAAPMMAPMAAAPAPAPVQATPLTPQPQQSLGGLSQLLPQSAAPAGLSNGLGAARPAGQFPF